MKIIKYNNKDFFKYLKNYLIKRYSKVDNKLITDVRSIISDVQKNGDNALVKYSNKFDKIKISKKKLLFNQKYFNQKINVNKTIINSFKKAIKNITSFHQKQFPKNIIQKKIT